MIDRRRERKESHTKKNSFILIPITRWLQLCCAVLTALCFDMCIQRPLKTVLILIWVRSIFFLFQFEFIFGFFVAVKTIAFRVVYIQIKFQSILKLMRFLPTRQLSKQAEEGN
jgi:hypothetical protein